MINDDSDFNDDLFNGKTAQRLGKSVSWAKNNWDETDSIPFCVQAVNKNAFGMTCSSHKTLRSFDFQLLLACNRMKHMTIKPVLNWVNICFMNIVWVFIEPKRSLVNIIGS